MCARKPWKPMARSAANAWWKWCRAHWHSGASIAVAVTGIAGPGGGSDDKPVGTVWVGWKKRGGYARAEVFHFEGDRDAVRRQTVATALRGVAQLLVA